MDNKLEIQRLARIGIHFGSGIQNITSSASDFAMDAVSLAPTLVTAPNGGVPAWLTSWFDPAAIEILLAPTAATQIAPEVKKGDNTTTTVIFRTREAVGQLATYGDFSPNGMVSNNTNYPSRETYKFQTWFEVGDDEQAAAAKGYIDVLADKQWSVTEVIARGFNKFYLNGVAGLKNYGLMNDPNLTAPVAATVNYATAEPEAIANDFVRQVGLLITQSNGLITGSERMTFASAPSTINDINRTNIYGLSAFKKIRESYPNIEFVGVPEYDTAAGRLAQLWCQEVRGQKTVELGFTDKMRAGRMEVYSTSIRQKHMAGTAGAMVYRPFACTQTLGV